MLGYLKRHHLGLVATFIALGGTAYASGVLPPHSVGTGQLEAGAVGTAQLKRGAVGMAQLKRGAVGLGQISPGTRSTLQQAPAQPSPTDATYQLPAPRMGWLTAPGFPHVTYYRDTNRVVHLAGAAYGYYVGSAGLGPGSPGPVNECGVPFGNGEYSAMIVLPAGDRPSGHLAFAVASGSGTGEVDVTPDGWVSCVRGAGDQYVSLDRDPVSGPAG